METIKAVYGMVKSDGDPVIYSWQKIGIATVNEEKRCMNIILTAYPASQWLKVVDADLKKLVI